MQYISHVVDRRYFELYIMLVIYWMVDADGS